jgi:hypothetical protein
MDYIKAVGMRLTCMRLTRRVAGRLRGLGVFKCSGAFKHATALPMTPCTLNDFSPTTMSYTKASQIANRKFDVVIVGAGGSGHARRHCNWHAPA